MALFLRMKKWMTSGLLTVLLFNLSFFATPGVAHAQLATISPDVIAADQARTVVENFEDVLREALVGSISTALINLMSQMANQFAYDSAVWIASGGNAERPLFDPRTAEDYLRDYGETVVAQFYDELITTNIEGGIIPTLGVYVPDDPYILRAMRNGLEDAVKGNIPETDYPEVAENFEGYLATLSVDPNLSVEDKTSQILSVIAEGFDPRVNEVSAGLQIQLNALGQAQVDSQVATDVFIRNEGFLPITDPYTGQVYTPASFLSDDLKNQLQFSQELPFQLTQSLFASDNALINIGLGAADIFTNTLLSELVNRWRDGLFEEVVNYPEFAANFNPFDPTSSSSFSRDRIIEQYQGLLSFRPLDVSDFNFLSQLSSCPATFRGSSPGVFNCAINASFASAISLADAGRPITLEEAIEDGYIDGHLSQPAIGLEIKIVSVTRMVFVMAIW
jgi:hypothetical protein